MSQTRIFRSLLTLTLTLAVAWGASPLGASCPPRAAAHPDGSGSGATGGNPSPERSSAAPVCCYYLKLVPTPGREDECGELCDITVLGPQRSCPENLTCGLTADRTLCFQQPAEEDECPDLDEDQEELCKDGTVCDTD